MYVIYSSDLVLLLDLAESVCIIRAELPSIFSKGSSSFILSSTRLKSGNILEVSLSLNGLCYSPIPPPPPRSQPPSLQWLPFRDARNVQKTENHAVDGSEFRPLPVDVGSFFPLITRFCTSGGCLGFLPSTVESYFKKVLFP